MDVAVSKKKIVLHLIVITESRVLFLVKGKIVHEAHLLDIVTVRAKEDKAVSDLLANMVPSYICDTIDP
jgi:hypothetical protein